MNIYGTIKFQTKIRVNKEECLGKCEAWNNHFRIVIAKAAGQTFLIFAETILHELFHLWIFILMAMTKLNISDKQQHKIIDEFIPKILKQIKKYKEGD